METHDIGMYEMIFKEDKLRDQLAQCSVWLENLAEEMDEFCKINFKKEIVITRVTDPVVGESGVHIDYRAFDVRNQTESGYYFDQSEIEKILAFFNHKYARTDNFRTVIHHSFNGGMFHLHCQISKDMDVYRRTKAGDL